MVQAQSNGVPAEFPPASFTGNQFVDSQGCAFIRAGISGVDRWVPRVDRARNQLCHFQPTFAAVAEATAEEPAEEMVADAMATVEADTPTSEVTTSLANAPLTIERPEQPLPVARASVATSVAPVAVETPPSPAVPRMTLAEVCVAMAANGRTYINAATGDPVVCGATNAKTTPKLALFGNPEIPASNPTSSVRNVPNPPAGYRRVWSDGRLNTQRGLPNG